MVGAILIERNRVGVSIDREQAGIRVSRLAHHNGVVIAVSIYQGPVRKTGLVNIELVAISDDTDQRAVDGAVLVHRRSVAVAGNIHIGQIASNLIDRNCVLVTQDLDEPFIVAALADLIEGNTVAGSIDVDTGFIAVRRAGVLVQNHQVAVAESLPPDVDLAKILVASLARRNLIGVACSPDNRLIVVAGLADAGLIVIADDIELQEVTIARLADPLRDR